MARTQTDLDQFRRAFLTYLGRPASAQDVSDFEGSPISLSDRILEAQVSPEAEGFRVKKVRARFNPQLEELSFGLDQARTEAELARRRLSLEGQGLGLAEQGVKQERTQLEQDIADAIKRINKQREQEQTGFINQQQRLGLRRSGLTEGGLSEIATNTTESLNRLELNRANRLAQLALQEQGIGLQRGLLDVSKSGVENAFASAIRQGEMGRSRLEQAIQDAIAGQEQGDFEQQAKLAALAADLPEGQNLNLGRFGTIAGTKRVIPKFDTVDLGDRVAFIDELGNITKTEKKGKLPSVAGGGSVGTTADTVDSYAQALADGDIKPTQVPSKYRASALKKSNVLKESQNNPQKIVNDLGQYKAQGYTRNDIEQQYISELGRVPDYIITALDQLYPVQQSVFPSQSPNILQRLFGKKEPRIRIPITRRKK